jgi:hypothetical protein
MDEEDNLVINHVTMDEEDNSSVSNHVKMDQEDNNSVTNNVNMEEEDLNSVSMTEGVSAAVLENCDNVEKHIQAKAEIHFELQQKQIQVFLVLKLLFLSSVTSHIH